MWQISLQIIQAVRLVIFTMIKWSKILKPNRKGVSKCLIYSTDKEQANEQTKITDERKNKESR